MNRIATVGADLPVDLLNATGRFAGPLDWSVGAPTPKADAWLESKFAPWARSILEDWAEGRLDALEQVIFSRSDDNSQRLYYYVCELRRRGALAGPEPQIFDAARLRRASSRDHMAAQVRKLADRLGLSDQDVERGIAETNAARNRVSAPAATERQAPTCLLAGTAPPDRRLHDMVAGCGWIAVGPTLGELWRDPGPVVAEATGDPVEAIADQLHARSDGPRGLYDPASRAVRRVSEAGARAAILWYTEEEEALVWHLPAQRRALEQAAIPSLILTRRDWAGRDGVDREIENFLKGLTT